MNLSREIRNRSQLTFKCPDRDQGRNMDLRFFRDPGGQNLVRSFTVKAKPAVNEVIIFYPEKDGTVKIINVYELFKQNLEALKNVDLKRPVPRKIRILAPYIQDNNEQPETLRAEMELARKIGINGDFLNLGPLEKERANLGPNVRHSANRP